jgi:predicted nucleic acid-binding protein
VTPTGEARRWLIDKSALVRLGESRNIDQWANRIDLPVSSMPIENSSPAIERRAVALQNLLAVGGQHRAPSVPDLLIAATAELASLIVLHLDKDFELIADLTGQPLERLDQPPSQT